jgi:secernin
VEHAIDRGWCKSRGDFDFARCYSDFLYTRLDGCRVQQSRSTELLEAERGRITVETMMAALRDHGAHASGDHRWNPGKGWLMDTLCVHASLGPLRPSQSTGAMIAHLDPDLTTCWLTATSATCTGIFKPVYLGGAGLPDLGPEPDGTYDPSSLWWRHEELHRTVIRDYPTRLSLYREERDALEAAFLRESRQICEQYRHPDDTERAQALADFARTYFDRTADATARWAKTMSSVPAQHRPPLLFSLAWNLVDKRAGFEAGRSSPETEDE